MTRIAEPTAAAIADAARRLRAGGVVAFPTETVYGLGASTFDRAALDLVYALKGRPADNPLIAHVADAADARVLTPDWDNRCAELAARFWPGPLALVVPRADAVPVAATGGRDTVAVRAPDHPVARALLRAVGGPVSAPSANRSGHVSPTTARHVADDFPDEDLLVLDGGPCAVGLESTVLDLTVTPPRVLRPGGVTVAALESVLGTVAASTVETQSASPGTAPAHYAPARPARLVDAGALSAHLERLAAPAAVLCFDGAVVAAPHRAVVMPHGVAAYEQLLYAALRLAETMDGVEAIVIEAPPSGNDAWRAVHDRLRRATITP